MKKNARKGVWKEEKRLKAFFKINVPTRDGAKEVLARDLF